MFERIKRFFKKKTVEPKKAYEPSLYKPISSRSFGNSGSNVTNRQSTDYGYDATNSFIAGSYSGSDCSSSYTDSGSSSSDCGSSSCSCD